MSDSLGPVLPGPNARMPVATTPMAIPAIGYELLEHPPEGAPQGCADSTDTVA